MIKKHVKTPHSSVYEVLLGNPYLIEGVHIVPNGIGVPIGSGVTFEGQTYPTLDDRSFTFDLFGRNLDTNEIKLILSINVEGGVQWAPLASPQNGWAIDYIVFSGNFDTVSIIIHGMILESHALTEVARDYFFQGPPFFPDAGTHEFDDEDITDSPIIINDEQQKLSKQKDKDHLRRYNATLAIPVNTLHDKLTGIAAAYADGTEVITKPTTLLKKSLLKSYIYSDFHASNDKIASLVGTVYSIDVDKILGASDVYEVIKAVTNLGKEIDSCYQSSLNSSVNDAYEPYGETIGDETAVIIATLMFNLNTKYLKGNHEYNSVESMVDMFHALISTTSLVVVNEITCLQYHSLGGVSILLDLVTKSPSLPESMLNEVIKCLNHAVIHPNIAIELFTIPSTIVMVPPKVATADDDDEDIDIWSGDEEEDDVAKHTLTQYEALVSVYSSLSSSSIVLPAYNQLLNYLNLPDACHSLHQHAVAATTKDLPQLIEFVNLLITIYNESGKKINTTTAVVSEDVIPDVEIETVDDNDKIISTCTTIAAAADVIIAMLQSVLTVIYMDRSSVTPHTDDRNYLYTIYSVFKSHNFFSSILVFTNYMKLLHEAVVLLDWKKGYQMDILASKVSSLKGLLSSLVIRTMKLGDAGELLLDAHVIIHLWSTLCKAGVKVDDDFIGDLDNVLLCSSLNDILTTCDDKIALYPLGWATWFIVYILAQIEIIVKESDKIKNAASNNHSVDMQALSVALECIRDASHCPLGQSVVCRLLSKYCIENIAFLAAYDTPLGSQASTGLNLVPGAMTESCSYFMMLLLSNMDAELNADVNIKSKLSVISTACNNIRNSNLYHMYSDATREHISTMSNFLHNTFSFEQQQNDHMVVTETKSSYDGSVLSVDKILEILEVQFTKVVSVESVTALGSVNILFSLLSAEVNSCNPDELEGLVTHLNTFTSRICTYYRLVTPYLHSDDVEVALNALYEKNKAYNIPVEAFKYAQYFKNSFNKSVERPTSEVIIRSTKIYLSCIVTLLELLDLVLRKLHQNQYRFFYYPVINGVFELQCLSNTICASTRAGTIGILVRKINSACTAIYKQYIPAASTATHSDNLHLVNYICRRAVQMPMYLSTTVSVLLDLMPTKSSSSNHDDAWENYLWSADSSENTVTTGLSISECVLQCDQTSIHHPLGTAKNNVMHVIILSLHSSCKLFHKSVVLLCRKLVACGARSAKVVSATLCSLLTTYSTNVLHNDVTNEGANQSYNTTIARILVTIDGLCNRGHVCVSLIENGVLYAIFGFMQSQDKDLVLLSLQVLSSLFRGVGSCIQKLDNILTHNTTASLSSNYSSKVEAIKDALLLVYSGIIDSIIIFLPNVINRFSDTTGTAAAGGISISIWLQSAILMGMLPMKQLLMFIAALPQSVRIEAIAIKIWQAFDDAFQGLIEATETYKGVKDDVTIDKVTANYFLEGCKGESLLREAHMQLAITTTALRAIIDATINAFEFGGISIMSLKAALRATMADPKKVGQRIFMTYSNWAMTEAETTVALLSHGLHRTSSSIMLPYARLPTSTVDISEGDSYASRHALINQSLLSLQFTLLKASKYVNNKQRPTAKKIVIDKNIDIPVQIDLLNPFKGLMTSDTKVDTDAVTRDLYIVYNHLKCNQLATLSASSGSVYFDAFNSLMRRHLTNSSAFINYDPSSYEKVSGYIFDKTHHLHLKACQKVVTKISNINDEEIRKELQRFGKKQRTIEPSAGGYFMPPGYPVMPGGFPMPPPMHGGFPMPPPMHGGFPMPPFPPPQYR